LRVLITNNTLDARAGSELYVRDLAAGLLRRGHRPVAFSTRLGAVAAELRAATVPVVDDLGHLAEPPELIHGHHHLETMIAALHFPAVPVVSFCHGWLPWEERPPVSPRIGCYVAVDEVCRDRLVAEHGIAPERVEVLLNFVDLERFRPRGPLPSRPRRALAFSNYASETSSLPVLREACSALGIDLDVAGVTAGRAVARPEDVLPAFDLVFAKARSALEALAVGAAVVVCDTHRLGPMVTAGELPRLRSLNFGVRLLQRRLDVAGIVAEVARYDASDAALVQGRIREEAGLEAALDRIESIYRRVVDTAPPSPVEESRSASRYLLSLAPALKDVGEAEHERNRLEGALQASRAEASRLRERIQELEAEAATATATAAAAVGELRSEVDRIRDTASKDVGEAEHEQKRLEGALQASRAEASRLRERIQELEAGAATATAAATAAAGAVGELRSEVDRIRGTVTWRLRQFLLSRTLVRAAHRAVRSLV
jgi:hypothetical protein